MAIHTKSKQESIITAIIELMDTGANYDKTFVQICADFGISKRTFCKYWLLAKDGYDEKIKAIREDLFSRQRAQTIKYVKEMPITKNRVLHELLLIVEKGKDRDKINALKLVCDIEGYKAPVKQDITMTAITPVFGSNPLIDNVIDITDIQPKQKRIS